MGNQRVQAEPEDRGRSGQRSEHVALGVEERDSHGAHADFVFLIHHRVAVAADQLDFRTECFPVRDGVLRQRLQLQLVQQALTFGILCEGRGWRSNALVEQREMPVWYFRITKYADRR